jgi:seryl-tRNA synthetase
MIDLSLLHSDPDLVRRVCRAKGSDVDVDRLIAADAELRVTQARWEDMRHRQKKFGKNTDIRESQALKTSLQEAAGRARLLQRERDELWARVPNLFAGDTPPGDDDSHNVELLRAGDPVPADTARDHEAIGTRLGIFDLERGAKVAGSGFYYWRGDGARLAWAVFSRAQDLLVERGFVPMITPLVAREQTFFGTGYLPFFADQLYRIEGADLSLIGTSEQTLIGFYANQVLDPGSLPIRLTAFSPCFRTEAGAAGRASRGGYRVHQFHKVEQVVICEPQDSERWLDECQRNVEDLLTEFELPYRVVRVCLGDMGAPAYKKYDTESWFPSFGGYRETHSNTNLWDYQARRFGIRYRDANGKMTFPHTISCTAITDRAVLAILENKLDAAGGVVIPKSLSRYLGGQERIGPAPVQ